MYAQSPEFQLKRDDPNEAQVKAALGFAAVEKIQTRKAQGTVAPAIQAGLRGKMQRDLSIYGNNCLITSILLPTGGFAGEDATGCFL